jgi:hypothetical protein
LTVVLTMSLPVAQRKHAIALLTNKLHDLEAEATAAQARAQHATNAQRSRDSQLCHRRRTPPSPR